MHANSLALARLWCTPHFFLPGLVDHHSVTGYEWNLVALLVGKRGNGSLSIKLIPLVILLDELGVYEWGLFVELPLGLRIPLQGTVPTSGSEMYPLLEEGLKRPNSTPRWSGLKTLLKPGSGSLVNLAGFAPTTEGNVPTTSDVEAMAIKVLMVRVMNIGKAIGSRGIPSAAHTIPGFNY